MNNLGEQVSSTQLPSGMCERVDSVLYIPGIAGNWNGTLQLFHIEPRLRLPVFSTTGCTPYNTLFWGPSNCRGPCRSQTGQFYYGCAVLFILL